MSTRYQTDQELIPACNQLYITKDKLLQLSISKSYKNNNVVFYLFMKIYTGPMLFKGKGEPVFPDEFITFRMYPNQGFLLYHAINQVDQGFITDANPVQLNAGSKKYLKLGGSFCNTKTDKSVEIGIVENGKEQIICLDMPNALALASSLELFAREATRLIINENIAK